MAYPEMRETAKSSRLVKESFSKATGWFSCEAGGLSPIGCKAEDGKAG